MIGSIGDIAQTSIGDSAQLDSALSETALISLVLSVKVLILISSIGDSTHFDFLYQEQRSSFRDSTQPKLSKFAKSRLNQLRPEMYAFLKAEVGKIV